MAASLGGKSLVMNQGGKDRFVRVRKRDLEKLITEVMQLKDFLPRVVNRDLIKTLQKFRTYETFIEKIVKEQEQLRQKCLHLESRLDAAQTECQKEREEKLLLREQLLQSKAELQQQADFCSSLGSVSCCLLWGCSSREDVVTLWVTSGKLQPFLAVATQTLESFTRSLDVEMKGQNEDHDSHENQFVRALAGTITNIAAIPCGRDILTISAHGLVNALIKVLELMKPGVLPKLKVLTLMALYNVSISVKGLQYITENRGLMPLIWSLLNEKHWEVCLHSLRLLQSVLLEEDLPLDVRSSLLDPDLLSRVTRLASSAKPSLKLTAQQTMEDLQARQQAPQRAHSKALKSKAFKRKIVWKNS